MNRPFLLYFLVLLHFLLALGALYGGWMLLTDPLGFGMRPEWLDRSPFRSYTFPGLFLLVVLGVMPILVAVGLLRRTFFPWGYAFNIYRDRHWAWTFSLLTGLILVAWIAVQLAWVPYFWLQPVMLTWAWAILVVTLWPSVMRYFQKSR